jgi:hypothetical protein
VEGSISSRAIAIIVTQHNTIKRERKKDKQQPVSHHHHDHHRRQQYITKHKGREWINSRQVTIRITEGNRTFRNAEDSSA